MAGWGDVSLTAVPPRPQGAVLCPTCDTWVLLVNGQCPFNQHRYRDGKVRPGGTCRLCWGHTTSPAYERCAACDITVRRQTLERSHGAYGYRAGCRCPVCTEAQLERMRTYRAQRRSAGTVAEAEAA